jgi:UDP-N-acetylglucosamine transferase subunit ALG13
MIFITVGTHFHGFERLIQEMDLIAGKIDEEVIAQIGSTKYQPKNLKYFTYLTEEQISKYFTESRIIVTHAGAGTLLTILKYNKPVIIVPRLKKYNEIIDNHQLELAEVLKNRNNVIIVYDIKNLKDALTKTEKLTYTEYKQKKELVFFLKNYIGKMKK